MPLVKRKGVGQKESVTTQSLQAYQRYARLNEPALIYAALICINALLTSHYVTLNEDTMAEITSSLAKCSFAACSALT